MTQELKYLQLLSVSRTLGFGHVIRVQVNHKISFPKAFWLVPFRPTCDLISMRSVSLSVCYNYNSVITKVKAIAIHRTLTHIHTYTHTNKRTQIQSEEKNQTTLAHKSLLGTRNGWHIIWKRNWYLYTYDVLRGGQKRSRENQNNHHTDTMFRYLIKVVFLCCGLPQALKLMALTFWTSLGFSHFYLTGW